MWWRVIQFVSHSALDFQLQSNLIFWCVLALSPMHHIYSAAIWLRLCFSHPCYNTPPKVGTTWWWWALGTPAFKFLGEGFNMWRIALGQLPTICIPLAWDEAQHMDVDSDNNIITGPSILNIGINRLPFSKTFIQAEYIWVYIFLNHCKISWFSNGPYGPTW